MKPTTKTAPAASVAALVAAGAITMVPLDHLLAHPDLKNRTIDKAHVADLYESIKQDGLDTPLASWDGGAPDKKMKISDSETVPANFLIAGFHRREALKRLRKENPDRFNELFPSGAIPVTRRTGALVEMICLQLRENVAHLQPDASTLFPQITRLKEEFKMKNVAIAKKIGKSESWVSRMLTVSAELGDEGAELVKAGDASLSDVQEVAEAKKRAAKTGTKFDTKAALAKVKSKTAAKKSAGNDRAEKRASVKTLHGRYKALPASTPMGAKYRILESVLNYLAGESDDLPPELQKDPEAKKPAVSVKVAAKPAAK